MSRFILGCNKENIIISRVTIWGYKNFRAKKILGVNYLPNFYKGKKRDTNEYRTGEKIKKK